VRPVESLENSGLPQNALHIRDCLLISLRSDFGLNLKLPIEKERSERVV
jgi:hypothetical protein